MVQHDQKKPLLAVYPGGRHSPADLPKASMNKLPLTGLPGLSTEKIASKISYLQGQLADGAKTLRSELVSYLSTMASSRQDELSGAWVEFLNPNNKSEVLLTLENGETDDMARAQPKIDRMVAECIKTARSDLDFLRETLSELQTTGAISEDRVALLTSIMSENSYWRFVKMR